MSISTHLAFMCANNEEYFSYRIHTLFSQTNSPPLENIQPFGYLYSKE